MNALEQVNAVVTINRREITAEKPRVCAYCRVSTLMEGQQDSFIMQTNHYNKLINGNADWEFAGVYSDHGIRGTSKEKREGFLRMIKDCELSKIDMVITKSVSRFARNTLDSLETIRRLKKMGVTIYFENENLNTMSEHSEIFFDSHEFCGTRGIAFQSKKHQMECSKENARRYI